MTTVYNEYAVRKEKTLAQAIRERMRSDGKRASLTIGYIMNEKQKEVMLIAQEECAEVIQAISKCFRFGFDDSYEGETNQQKLETEVGDLMAMI